MTMKNRKGRPVQPDHQSRIIGMGLLLGKISFEALETAYQSVGGSEDKPELGSMIQELLRKGAIEEESLARLESQVGDLERLLVDRESSEDDRPTVKLEVLPLADSITAEQKLPESQRLLQTPPRGIWGSLPNKGIREEDRHALLSVLTIPKWNQYINLQFIGEGGMGRIFKAFDPTLNRVVALKFLRWVGEDSVRDLFNEARLQAQVDHPNICKVYEVREWNGQVYVAMQFIKGETLDKVAITLSLKEKIELMEVVADAVHAAHRHGLVHRDLKPANIMVEPTPDGGLNPYILDFGLARDLAKTNDSMQGSIVGTVHYMAPEQARGDSAAIERRTDVYALGITLYELFTGAPPFDGIQGMECLRYILDADIPPVNRINTGIHRDLNTIVMKCLEKDITQRYESARALAEDLRRYRDEEPIHARSATFWYRSGKFARKNKTLVSLAALGLASVLFFAGLGLHARWTASSQAYWAQHFGQEAERIEALLRYARLQPTHDIRPELEAVGDRIRSMEMELARVGGQAQGPGSYALGRAYLALGEADKASAHLDRAWNAGFQVKDAAYARGRAMGQRYFQALQKARMIGEPQLRQVRLKELEVTLRNPATALLRSGRGSSLEPTSFQEGLLALYDYRYQEALNLARDAVKRAPWFYEGQTLEAEVHLEQARGESDPALALVHLQNAGQALVAAAKIAPSDPDLCDLQSRRWWEEMILKRRMGKEVREAHDAFGEACQRWGQILPEAAGPGARMAWGNIERARAAEPSAKAELIKTAIDQAQAVLRTHPDHEEALGSLAAGLSAQAYAALDAGRDPRSVLDQAHALLRRALESSSPAFELFEPYAATFWARIEYEKNRGIDPAGTVQVAIASIQTLTGRFPQVPDFHGFIGGLLGELADYQANHGTDPAPVVQRALEHLDLATRMAPARFDFHFTRGSVFLAQAQFRVLNDLPALKDLDASEAAYRAAQGCNAASSGPFFGLGEVGLLRCQELERLQTSPLLALQRAETAMADSLVQSEHNWRTALFNAQANLIRARWTSEDSEIRFLLKRAEQEAERAVTQCGRQPASLFVMAQVQIAWASHFPAEASIRKQKAKGALEEALRQDAGFESARRIARSLGVN